MHRFQYKLLRLYAIRQILFDECLKKSETNSCQDLFTCVFGELSCGCPFSAEYGSEVLVLLYGVFSGGFVWVVGAFNEWAQAGKALYDVLFGYRRCEIVVVGVD